MTTRGKETVDFIKSESQTVTSLMHRLRRSLNSDNKAHVLPGSQFCHVSDDNSGSSKGSSQQSLLHFVIAIGETIFDVRQGRDQPNLPFVNDQTSIVLITVPGHVIKIY